MTNMPDFRMQLSSTDYGNFLANEPLPLSTATIADKVSVTPPFLERAILGNHPAAD